MTILLRCLLLYLPTSFVLPSHFHLLNDLTNVFLVCSYSWIVVLLQIFLKHQGGKHYKKKNHIILWKRITISHPLKIDYFPFSISWHKYKVNINQARYNWVVDSGGILNFLYMSFFFTVMSTHTTETHTLAQFPKHPFIKIQAKNFRKIVQLTYCIQWEALIAELRKLSSKLIAEPIEVSTVN